MGKKKAADKAQRRPETSGAGIRRVCPLCNQTYKPEILVCPNDGTGLLEIPDAPLLTGTHLEGRYDIGGVVGTGGMGVVYRAHQRSMERDVAIKVLHPQYAHDPKAVKRFFREAQASSRLIHPHVVTVYDFGRSPDDHVYMVMELLEGWTLGDLIHHRAPLSPSTAVVVAVQICAALEAAHGRRIVHRDLKPDNVQLVARDGSVLAKVLDFGIARVMRDPDAQLGMQLSTVDIAGTPAYMSPEQIMGKDPDPRTDLYSLGVILYEMLTGKRPFMDENSVTLCMKQLNEDPPPFRTHVDASSIPDDVGRIVFELLAKDAASRPSDATAVQQRLLACGVCDGDLATQWTSTVPGLGSLGSLPTRPDLGCLMPLPTHQGTGAASLGDIIEAVRSAAPSRDKPSENGVCEACAAEIEEDVLTCPRCAAPIRTLRGQLASALDTGLPDRPDPPCPAAAAAALLGADAESLEESAILMWLRGRRAEGWDVYRRHAVAVVRVPDTLGISPRGCARLLLARLDALRGTLGPDGATLRMGLAESMGDEALDLEDLVRRLAASGSQGDLVMPAALATGMGLRNSTVTSIFLPSGKAVSCAAVTGGHGDANEPGPPPLIGRGRESRRLEKLWEKARRGGPLLAIVTSGRGGGRTALLQSFVRGRAHLVLRVAPGAHAWPGHTAARLVLACLGLSDDAPLAALRARLDPLPGHLRTRLRLLLLDEASEDVTAGAGLVQALMEVLTWRAGDGPFVLVIDDAHLMDAASLQLLQELRIAASGRPWLLLVGIASGDSQQALTGWNEDHRMELRPLGLRAATELLKREGIESNQRPRLIGTSAGNPLALRLLALDPGRRPLPRAESVVTTILPEVLRADRPANAETAWMEAVFGAPERPDDLSVRAARLYLEVGLPAKLSRWLETRVREGSGLRSRLAPGLRPEPRHAKLRAARSERLGLWRLAAAEAATAAAHGTDVNGTLRLQSALWLATAGEVEEALERFEEAVSAASDAVDPNALVRFASVLLDAGENRRAEDILARVRSMMGKLGSARALGEVWALLARCAVRRNDLAGAMSFVGRGREAQALIADMDARASRLLEALLQEVRAEVALAERDLAAARTNLRQARDTFRDLGQPTDAIRCLVDLGRAELDDGDAGLAADTFRAAIGLAATAGLMGEMRRARIGLGESHVCVGNVDEGATILRRVLRESRRGRGDMRSLTAAATGMARAMVARELPQDALRYGKLALESATSDAARARAHLLVAEAHIAAGEHRKAIRALQEATRAAASTGQGHLHAQAEDRLIELELVHGMSAPTEAARI